MNARLYVSGETNPQRLSLPQPSQAPLVEVFPWLATSRNPDDLLGEQFSVFADEARAWADMTLATALEGWPDNDWSGD